MRQSFQKAYNFDIYSSPFICVFQRLYVFYTFKSFSFYKFERCQFLYFDVSGFIFCTWKKPYVQYICRYSTKQHEKKLFNCSLNNNEYLVEKARYFLQGFDLGLLEQFCLTSVLPHHFYSKIQDPYIYAFRVVKKTKFSNILTRLCNHRVRFLLKL